MTFGSKHFVVEGRKHYGQIIFTSNLSVLFFHEAELQ